MKNRGVVSREFRRSHHLKPWKFRTKFAEHILFSGRCSVIQERLAYHDRDIYLASKEPDFGK